MAGWQAKKFDFSRESCYLSEAVIQGEQASIFRPDLEFFKTEHNKNNPWVGPAAMHTGGRGERNKHMAVKIRLKRVGKKKAPSYRVVVADARSPRDGRIIENIGWYNPLVEPSAIHIDEEKALGWLKNGALPTESVSSLLKRSGILDRFEQAKAAAK